MAKEYNVIKKKVISIMLVKDHLTKCLVDLPNEFTF